MRRGLPEGIRKSSIWMGGFATAFVVMYSGIVLSSWFFYRFFMGFTPGADRNLLRLVFYGISVLAAVIIFYIRKKRTSAVELKKAATDEHALIKHIFATLAISFSVSEAPLIAGFFLFFLSAMYMDFFVLAALSIILIFLNIQKVEFWEERLKAAKEGR